ncbi:MAG TPA: NADH-quinone oxidoreductase subunit L [Chloroflexota bacterium]|nr:NADH-quinone oxidoreductase subunit L [Chloroflexota bacterium]
MDLLALALVVLLAPFGAFLFNAFVAQRTWALAGLSTILGVGISFLASLLVFAAVQGGARLDVSWPWLTIAAGQARAVEVGLQVDPLTAVMLLVVSGVSLFVQIYSWGYLHERTFDAHGHPHVHRDPGFARYYTWMALFTASMLGLVLANGFLALYVCWELVGLCSYLLIGFWYQKPEAALAAKKAFLTTRLGDCGFLIGLLYLWAQTGTFTFSQLEPRVAALAPEAATLAALLVFCGAVGKSAQFPLHVWLPDAMEGPTPVSALIHAATMVAAGVYLVARTMFLFEHASAAMLVVALIGGFTAFFAATMGLVNTDIKRVLAYSTISQLGYMMLGLGVGAVGAGIFHLFTHAWFKALLFLTAGNVIHGAGTQDLRAMGGLARRLPWTFAAMLAAALALAGLPPLSGFWSKDAIIAAVAHYQPPAAWGGLAGAAMGLLMFFALATVLLTAFYITRLLCLAFGGAWRGVPQVYPHVEEAPAGMLWPVLLLAVPTVLAGFWGAPFVSAAASFATFVEGHEVHEAFAPGLAALSVALALAGIGLAWALYGAGWLQPAAVTRLAGPLYRWAVNKWGFDDLYNALVGRGAVGLAGAAAWFDRGVIDGVVNGVAQGTVALGRAARAIQTGQVQTYAWVVFGGLVIVAVAILLPVVLGFRV